jgi:hypothetical protein
MNINRMANEYRTQIMRTGENIMDNIKRDFPRVSDNKTSVGQIRTNIKRWYNHLHRALGSEKDLKELLLVWECFVKLSELCDKNTISSNLKCDMIFGKAIKHMDRFFKKIPRLIEKSLTRSVRESGIHLR